MFHVEQKTSEDIPRDGSLEKLEFFERAGPFGLWFHFPGQGSRILRARRPRHATHMKQARATRLFHVEQFGGWPAGLVPVRQKGDPCPGLGFACEVFYMEQKKKVEKAKVGERLRGASSLIKRGSAHGRVLP